MPDLGKARRSRRRTAAVRYLRGVLELAGVLGALSPTNAGAGENYQVPAELKRRPELPEGMDARSARPLELGEAIQIAVRQNLGIVLSREQAAATAQTVGVAMGAFEPTVNASYSLGSAVSPPPVSLLRNGDAALQLTTITDNWNVSLNQTLETGTQLSLGFTNLRTSVNQAGAVPLLYNSNLALQLVQPLLKNFAFDLDVPRADVLRARFATVRAKDDVRIAMIATVHTTDDAYWDLVGALKNYEVARESLKLADDMLALTQRQIDAGILATSDFISAETTRRSGRSRSCRPKPRSARRRTPSAML